MPILARRSAISSWSSAARPARRSRAGRRRTTRRPPPRDGRGPAAPGGAPLPSPQSLLDEPQRAGDVDAALAVVGVGPRHAEVIGRLEDPLANEGGLALAQLRHEERREP